ncbi:MAG: protein kinase [Planctomycetales bacterium]|nr:protein kinase [Planctomycetales bacterium]
MPERLSKADERRVERVIDELIRQSSAGQPVSLDQFHLEPPLQDHVLTELKRRDLIAQIRQNFEEAGSVHPTLDSESPTSDTARLSVRCPHCANSVDIDADVPWSEIICIGCGNSFSLVSDNLNTKEAPSLKQIAHFELIERLGVGGFGTVWKARDTILDRAVALKLPRKGQLTEEEIDKFLREARAAAQLRHPNIVSVHEVGRTEDTVYIVNDLVRGVSLSDWAAIRSPLPFESAVLCLKISNALAEAHRLGIVHRDLKPGNILVDAHDEPHIMDFGLAKRDAGEVTVTIEGQIVGTPAYMAPEQAMGMSHACGPPTDIYSLGVVLFELLTGELPFRGNTNMLLHQVLNDEPPLPRSLNNHVPKDIETICLKCLEKKPEKRFPSAAELADELARFTGQQPILSRPVGRFGRIVRWCQRHTTTAGLIVACLVTLVAGTVATTYFAMQALDSKKEADSAKQQVRTVRQQANEFESARNQATRMAADVFKISASASLTPYNQQLNAASSAFPILPHQTLRLLEDDHRCPPSHRDFTWRFLFRSCAKPHQTFAHPLADVQHLRFFAETNTLVLVDSLNNVAVFQSNQDGPFRWLPDGQDVPLLSERNQPTSIEITNHIVTVRVGDQTPQSREFDAAVTLAKASDLASNQVMVLQQASAGLLFWDLPTDQIQEIEMPCTAEYVVDVSVASGITAVVDDQGAIWMQRTESASFSRFEPEQGRFERVLVDGDSQRLFGATHDSQIVVWDLAADSQTTWLESEAAIESAVFSPDGQRLAAVTAGQLYVLNSLDGAEMLRPIQLDRPVKDIRWSPSSNRIAVLYGNGSVVVFDTERTSRQLQCPSSDVFECIAFESGESLLLGSNQTELLRWNMDDQPPTPAGRVDVPLIAMEVHPSTGSQFLISPVQMIVNRPGKDPWMLEPFDSPVTHVVCCGNQDIFYVGHQDGGVTRVRLNWVQRTEARTALDTVVGTIRALKATADNKTILVAGSQGLEFFDAKLGQHRAFVAQVGVTTADFLPVPKQDSDRLVLGNAAGELRLLRGESAIGTPVLYPQGVVRSLQTSRANPHFVYAACNGAFLVVDPFAESLTVSSWQPATIRSLAVRTDSNEEQIAWSFGAGQLQTSRLAFGVVTPELSLPTFDANLHDLRWSSDGSHLLGIRNNQLEAWAIDSNSTNLTKLDVDGTVLCYSWFDTDKTALVGLADGQVLATSLTPDGWQEKYRVAAHVGPVRMLAAFHNQRWVSYGDDQQLKLWSGSKSKPLDELALAAANALASLPDQQLLAVGSGQQVHLWRMHDKLDRISQPLDEHSGPITALAFTLSGRHVISAAEDRTIRIWPLQPGDARSNPDVENPAKSVVPADVQKMFDSLRP